MWLERLGLGMATVMREPSPSKRAALLDRAYELGIRYFDVAPIYGFGRGEAELGKLVRRGADDIQIATKFGRSLSRTGRVIGALQRPARAAARSAPFLRSAFHRSSGGVATLDAPTYRDLKSSIAHSTEILGVPKVHTFLTHEVVWTEEWSQTWQEAFGDPGFPADRLGVSGPLSLLRDYPASIVSSADVMQVPLSDRGDAFGRGERVYYAVISTLRSRCNALQSSRHERPVQPEWLGLLSDRDQVAFSLAAVLRNEESSRLLVGTSSASHLSDLIRGLSRWAEDTSVAWDAVGRLLLTTEGAT